MKNKNTKKLKVISLLVVFCILSMSGVAFASSYTTSVTIAYDSYLSGADRSYSGNRYSVNMKVNSITNDFPYTTCKFLVVHNNYFLGVKVSDDQLSTFSNNIYKGHTYMFEFPNTSIGSGTRAFDFSTQVGHNGFSASPVYLDSYD